jgi:hypothetical protein
MYIRYRQSVTIAGEEIRTRRPENEIKEARKALTRKGRKEKGRKRSRKKKEQ